MARTVVLGAGVAGLSVAIRLADLGHHVTVVEARPAPGGQVASAAVAGHVVDTGPVAFTLPAVFRDLFSATGRPIERELDLVPVDPALRCVFADKTRADIPNASRSGSIRALDDALGPGVGAQWEAVVEHGEQVWRSRRTLVLGHAGPPRRFGRRATAAGRSSLDDVSQRLLPDQRLRTLLASYATSIGDDPSQASGVVTVLPYLERTFGLWTVAGGLGRLVEALSRRAVERGARLRFGVPAAEIAADGGRVRAVRLADELVPADVVVSAIHPDALARLLPERRRRGRPASSWSWSRSIRDSGPSGSSVFSLTVLVPDDGVAAPPLRTVVVPDGGHPAVTMSPGPQTSDSSGRPGRLWVLHATGPPHQPDGDRVGRQSAGPAAIRTGAHCKGTSNTVGQLDRTAGVDWSAVATVDAYAEDVLDVVTSAGALSPAAKALHARTPLDLERDLGAPGGLVHGHTQSHPDGRVAPQARQVDAIVRRPGDTTSIRGLYLAGAGAHPGPGLPMAAISASIVADLIGRA